MGVDSRPSVGLLKTGKEVMGADSLKHDKTRAEALRTWALVVGMAASILLWGFFLFSAVGDKGPPPWDFDAIEDVPGSSPYAVHGPKESPDLGRGLGLSLEPVLGGRPVVPQHVGGKGHP
jgi:hypothetical protein